MGMPALSPRLARQRYNEPMKTPLKQLFESTLAQEPPVFPTDIEALFEVEFSASVFPYAGQEQSTEAGWSRLAYSHYWFGTGPWPSLYTSHKGVLQSIRVTPAPNACHHFETQVTHYLGEPDEAGGSPHYLHSMRYARWFKGQLGICIEFFEPGCELTIYRSGRT